MKTIILKENENYVEIAKKMIENNETIVFPTDTVYGIGANAFSEIAIDKIYQAKERDYSKALLLLVGRNYNIENLVENIGKNAKKIMQHFWPGGLTLIFKSKKTVAKNSTAGLDTIGIRIPNNKIALNILENCNIPLATTSANLSHEPSATDFEMAKKYMQNKTALMIDGGECKEKTASTIIDVTNDNDIKLLRQGKITFSEILEILK